MKYRNSRWVLLEFHFGDSRGGRFNISSSAGGYNVFDVLLHPSETSHPVVSLCPAFLV